MRTSLPQHPRLSPLLSFDGTSHLRCFLFVKLLFPFPWQVLPHSGSRRMTQRKRQFLNFFGCPGAAFSPLSGSLGSSPLGDLLNLQHRPLALPLLSVRLSKPHLGSPQARLFQTPVNLAAHRFTPSFAPESRKLPLPLLPWLPMERCSVSRAVQQPITMPAAYATLPPHLQAPHGLPSQSPSSLFPSLSHAPTHTPAPHWGSGALTEDDGAAEIGGCRGAWAGGGAAVSLFSLEQGRAEPRLASAPPARGQKTGSDHGCQDRAGKIRRLRQALAACRRAIL